MTVVLLLAALAAQGWSDRTTGRVDPAKTVRLTRPDLPQRRNPRDFEVMAAWRGGGKETEAAVADSLQALARLQTEDGSWDPAEGGSRLETTCLALLAFRFAGYGFWDQAVLPWGFGWRFGPGSAWVGPDPSYHQVFRRGISWLQERQQADGFIGARGGARSFRDHAIATRLFCEVVLYTRNLVLQGEAERAVAALEAEPFSSTADDPEGAAWAELALRGAAAVSLPFDRAVLGRLVPGLRLPAGDTPRKAAIDRLISIHLLYWQTRPPQLPAPEWDAALPSSDLRDWFWGTLVQRYGRQKSPAWTDWNERMKAALLSMTPADAESWALRALTFQVYYQFRISSVR